MNRSADVTIVRLNEDGKLVEVLTRPQGGRGEEIPREWLEMARAVLRVDIDQLNFIWHTLGGDWISVKLQTERDRINPTVLLQYRSTDPPYDLTPRELDVVTVIAAGFGNEAIAFHLDISRRTVDKHVERIFAKTQTYTRSGIAALAVDQGLLKLPFPVRNESFPLNIGKVVELSKQPASELSNARKIVRAPIVVGMPLPLQGMGSADAVEMLNGAQLAVDQLNWSGGVLDREIKLLAVDCDITNPRQIKSALNQLADEDAAAITIGYSYADPSIFELASAYEAPYLHASTLNHVVDWVRGDPTRFSNIFQTCASDINYGKGMARFLSWLMATAQWAPSNRRIAIIQPPWPGLDIGLNAIDAELEGKDWSISQIEAANSHQPDWTAVVNELNHIDPSVVLFASYMVEHSIAFQRAFRKSPSRALVYKLYSPSVPIYREMLGPDANGVLWATTTGVYSDAIGQTFQQSFLMRHGRRPGRSHAGIAYDRVNLLAGAWSRVGSAWNHSAVVTDLRKSIYRGVNGAYFFGNSGQVGLTFPDDTQDPSISQAHLVFQIQRGRQTILSPSPYAEGRFEMPEWLQIPTR